MKTSSILCIVLATALGIVTWLYCKGSSATATADTDSTATVNEAYDCIMTRASCRKFTDSLVSEAAIDSLLHAAMASPSARDQRPWQFVVITDRETLDTIASRCRNIKMAAQAPMAIAVCSDHEIAPEKPGEEFWVQDVSAVSENILLAAHSMGLGAVWCGIYPVNERVKLISELLELPANVVPLSIIPVGYPAAPLTPKDKFDAARIHYNTF